MVGAKEDVPVDEAEIIAGRVRPVIGKFDAHAFLAAAALGLHLAGEDLAGDNVEVFERVEEVVVKQGRVAVVQRCGRSWAQRQHGSVKSEIRNPKSERNPKTEIRNELRPAKTFRVSD